jgi:Kef-type K+ transport system membrane component KefB
MGTPPTTPRASLLRVGIAYAGMLAATVALFLVTLSLGGTLRAPAPTGLVHFGSIAARQQVDTLVHVLVALTVVIITARLLGALFKHLGQPPVIGEVVAGILLGPSLLGLVAPGVSAFLLPPSVAPYFSVLAQVGVILYMFLVGLHLDTAVLRRGTHTTVAISHASITVPFLLGGGLALWIYPHLSSSDVPFTAFALFIGLSMSVTAFPVLARILTDRGMQKSRIGSIALTCAAVDDVTAWCLLAFVSSIVYAQVTGAVYTVVLSLAYIGLVVLIVRPITGRLARWVDRRGVVTQPVIAAVIVAALLSALSTEYIGIHAIFGAFLLGAVIPHDSAIARELTRLEDLVVVLLLPAFFAFTGMRTQITLVNGIGQWMFCAVIILVACVGKFGGSALAARLTGQSWRDAASLGILMNTRGLVELIVLNVGLDLKVLNPTLFAMLVLMAIVTTIMTSPILQLLMRESRLRVPQGAEAALRGSRRA